MRKPELNRKTYDMVKRMDHGQMKSFCKSLYTRGYEEGKQEAALKKMEGAMNDDLISRSALMNALRGNVLVNVTPHLEEAIEEHPSVFRPVREKIITKVLEERKRQDAKWGEQNHIAPVWGMIIGEEYGEMCQAINEFGFNPTPDTEEQIYTEAIHTIASCMAMLECMESQKNYGGVGKQ